MKPKRYSILLALLVPWLGYSQSSRLDIVTEQACACLEKLDESKLEIGHLDRLAEDCIISSIIENINLYDDIVNIDSVAYFEEDVTDFVKGKETGVIFRLFSSCGRFKKLFSIISQAQLDDQLVEVVGAIVDAPNEHTIRVETGNGQTLDFSRDDASKGLYDIISVERALRKKVNIKYRELKYYNPDTQKYRMVRKIVSLDWLDRFTPIFEGKNKNKKAVDFIDQRETNDSLIIYADIFDQYFSSGNYNPAAHLKIIRKCGQADTGSTACRYTIFKSKNVSSLSDWTEDQVVYYPDVYQISIRQLKDSILVEEEVVPAYALTYQRTVFINRSCAFPMERFDEKEALHLVLSYYASLATYIEFLDAERSYFSWGWIEKRTNYRQLDSILSSQKLNYDCLAAVEEKIAQKEKEKADANAGILNQDTITFQYFYPYYFGARVILDHQRPTPKKRIFKEYLKFDYDGQWRLFNIVKLSTKTSSDGVLQYHLSYKRIRNQKPSLLFRKIGLSYIYDSRSGTLFEKDESMVWYNRYRLNSIGRAMKLSHPAEQGEAQIRSRVMALYLSYDDWDKYLSLLYLMDDRLKRQSNATEGVEYYELDRKASSISDGLKKLHLPIEFPTD